MINMTEEKLRAEIARLMAALRLENAQLRPQLAAGS
jgi:hypothetical protein